MFDKLLVMTDGSPVSDRLLDCGEGLRDPGSRYRSLHPDRDGQSRTWFLCQRHPRWGGP